MTQEIKHSTQNNSDNDPVTPGSLSPPSSDADPNIEDTCSDSGTDSSSKIYCTSNDESSEGSDSEESDSSSKITCHSEESSSRSPTCTRSKRPKAKAKSKKIPKQAVTSFAKQKSTTAAQLQQFINSKSNGTQQSQAGKRKKIPENLKSRPKKKGNTEAGDSDYQNGEIKLSRAMIRRNNAQSDAMKGNYYMQNRAVDTNSGAGPKMFKENFQEILRSKMQLSVDQDLADIEEEARFRKEGKAGGKKKRVLSYREMVHRERKLRKAKFRRGILKEYRKLSDKIYQSTSWSFLESTMADNLKVLPIRTPFRRSISSGSSILEKLVVSNFTTGKRIILIKDTFNDEVKEERDDSGRKEERNEGPKSKDRGTLEKNVKKNPSGMLYNVEEEKNGRKKLFNYGEEEKNGGKLSNGDSKKKKMLNTTPSCSDSERDSWYSSSGSEGEEGKDMKSIEETIMEQEILRSGRIQCLLVGDVWANPDRFVSRELVKVRKNRLASLGSVGLMKKEWADKFMKSMEKEEKMKKYMRYDNTDPLKPTNPPSPTPKQCTHCKIIESNPENSSKSSESSENSQNFYPATSSYQSSAADNSSRTLNSNTSASNQLTDEEDDQYQPILAVTESMEERAKKVAAVEVDCSNQAKLDDLGRFLDRWYFPCDVFDSDSDSSESNSSTSETTPIPSDADADEEQEEAVSMSSSSQIQGTDYETTLKRWYGEVDTSYNDFFGISDAETTNATSSRQGLSKESPTVTATAGPTTTQNHDGNGTNEQILGSLGSYSSSSDQYRVVAGVEKGTSSTGCGETVDNLAKPRNVTAKYGHEPGESVAGSKNEHKIGRDGSNNNDKRSNMLQEGYCLTFNGNSDPISSRHLSGKWYLFSAPPMDDHLKGAIYFESLTYLGKVQTQRKRQITVRPQFELSEEELAEAVKLAERQLEINRQIAAAQKQTELKINLSDLARVVVQEEQGDSKKLSEEFLLKQQKLQIKNRIAIQNLNLEELTEELVKKHCSDWFSPTLINSGNNFTLNPLPNLSIFERKIISHVMLSNLNTWRGHGLSGSRSLSVVGSHWSTFRTLSLEIARAALVFRNIQAYWRDGLDPRVVKEKMVSEWGKKYEEITKSFSDAREKNDSREKSMLNELDINRKADAKSLNISNSTVVPESKSIPLPNQKLRKEEIEEYVNYWIEKGKPMKFGSGRGKNNQNSSRSKGKVQLNMSMMSFKPRKASGVPKISKKRKRNQKR